MTDSKKEKFKEKFINFKQGLAYHHYKGSNTPFGEDSFLKSTVTTLTLLTIAIFCIVKANVSNKESAIKITAIAMASIVAGLFTIFGIDYGIRKHEEQEEPAKHALEDIYALEGALALIPAIISKINHKLTEISPGTEADDCNVADIAADVKQIKESLANNR